MPDFTHDSPADRVRKMEELFDILLDAEKNNPSSLRDDPILVQIRLTMAAYMDAGLWLQDYELDEQGAFPPGLKRGVLSQDRLYNFLQETEELYKSDTD